MGLLLAAIVPRVRSLLLTPPPAVEGVAGLPSGWTAVDNGDGSMSVDLGILRDALYATTALRQLAVT